MLTKKSTISFLLCMASLLVVGVLLALPVTGQAAGIGKDGTIAAVKGKANTLDELIAMYDSSSCIDCHGDKHEEWSQSVQKSF